MMDLVTHLAASLVDSPEEVKVSQQETADTITFELSVAQADLGKVIGKQGRTARAMRSLLAATAVQQDRKSRLDILE